MKIGKVLSISMLLVVSSCASKSNIPGPRTTIPIIDQPAPTSTRTIIDQPTVPIIDQPNPSPVIVTAGSFCSKFGTKGVTKTGKSMICKPSATDSRNRWRAP